MKEKYLYSLIDNIKQQQIKLKEIDFKANEEKSGFFKHQEIKTELEINIDNIGEGLITNEEDKNIPILICNYKFNLNYFTNNDIELVKLKCHYDLLIFLNDEVNNIIKEKKEQVISSFFLSSGKVMVYPYFRHISNLLTRESGFIFPALEPLKI